MYHLFVSSDINAWNGQPWSQALGRCLREFTADSLTDRFGDFHPEQVQQLLTYPCIFAYENGRDQPPKFGRIRAIERNGGAVRVRYDIQSVIPFISIGQLRGLFSELDSSDWEFNRTHWALKDVDLFRTLKRHGILLPDWTRTSSGNIDITTHQFDIALSFPGNARPLAEEIAGTLEEWLGPDQCFYDLNYQAQLARPSLDVLLHNIYRDRSKLIVAFIGSAYQGRPWCGLELRAIHDIILQRGHERIMYVRLDDGRVDGVNSTDGYVDARIHDATRIAQLIQQRLALLNKPA
jgi:hypothetical protein